LDFFFWFSVLLLQVLLRLERSRICLGWILLDALWPLVA